MREWLIAFIIAATISGGLSILVWWRMIMTEMSSADNRDSDSPASRERY